MTRRELVLLLGGAMTTARPLRAQEKPLPVIGFLGSTSPGPEAPFLATFRQGLSETGYVEGQNVAIEYRWAEGEYDRLPALAADLVSRNVDVVATFGGVAAAHAAKSATSTIPIVFETGVDPVEKGLVASFPRPGGNLTGVSILTGELMPKRLELLSELVPQVGQIALLVNPNNPTAERMMQAVQEAARAKRVQLHVLKAGAADEFETAFASLAQLNAGALLVGNDPFFFSRQTSWWRWRHAMPCRRCTSGVNSSQPVAWPAMEPASLASIARSGSMSAVFSRVPNPPICRSSSRPNSSW